MFKVYRKKSTIKAIQYNGNNFKEIAEFCREVTPIGMDHDGNLEIPTRESKKNESLRASRGYWIAKAGGDVWPIAPDFFEANYEEVKYLKIDEE